MGGRFWQSRWAFSRIYLAVTIVITALAIPVLKGLVYVGQWLDNVPFLHCRLLSRCFYKIQSLR